MRQWRRTRIAAMAAAIGLVTAGCSGGGAEDSTSASQADESAEKTDVTYPADGFGNPAWQAEALSDDSGARAAIYDDRVVRWGGSTIESRNPDGSVDWDIDLAEHFSDEEKITVVTRMAGGRLGVNTDIGSGYTQTFLLDAKTGEDLEKVDVPDGWTPHRQMVPDQDWGLSFQYQDDDQNNLVVNSDGSIDEFDHLLYTTGRSAVTLDDQFGQELTWHPTGGQPGKAKTYSDFAGDPDTLQGVAPRIILDETTAIIRTGDRGEGTTEMVDLSESKRLNVLEDCHPDDALSFHSSSISPNGEHIVAGNAIWEGTDATCLNRDGIEVLGQTIFDDGTVIGVDYSGWEDLSSFNPADNPGLILKDGEVIEEFDNPGSKELTEPLGTLSSDLVVYAGDRGAVVAVPRK